MLFLALFIICLISVPLAGGDLRALADLRLRARWLLVAALGLQILVISVIHGSSLRLLVAGHIASYLLAGVFLVLNRGVAGLWLVALGGVMNFAAIAANSGVMPASPAAVASADLDHVPGQFANSQIVSDPQLAFLGDVFSIPSSWPMSNVFSLGDICIAMGMAVALHFICGSKIVPSGRGEFTSLLRYRDFTRVWAAQVASNLGDWTYSLAVAVTLVETAGNAAAVAFLLIAQVGPAAVAGIVGAPLIDRLSRKTVMVVADVARAAAVVSLLLVAEPSLLHLYGVAACLGVFEALFQPSLQASIPNLVPQDRIVGANALVSLTFNAAIMAGPVLGGLAVAALGAEAALAFNAATFVISAWLISRTHIAQQHYELEFTPGGDLIRGLRYSLSHPLVRAVLIVTGLVMFAAALKSSFEPLFILDELHRGPEALGLVGAAWGVGMVLGSVCAPTASRIWARERLLWLSIAAVGVSVLATSQATELGPVLCLWILAGFGNAVGTVSYESMLQEQTPDLYRGRVMATSEAVLNMAYLGGASAAAWLSTHAGIRTSYASSGALLLLAAVMSWTLIRRVEAPTLPSAQLHLADAEELKSRTPPSETVSARRTSS